MAQCIETFIHCFIVVDLVPCFESSHRWVVFQINPLCDQIIRKWKWYNQCSCNASFLTHQNLVVRSVKSVLKYTFTSSHLNEASCFDMFFVIMNAFMPKWSNSSSYLHVSCNILNQSFGTIVIVLTQLTIIIRGSASINIVNKLLLLSTQ